MRHVLEEFFRYITLMQWWHLLKPLWVSGEFSLLQHAPILRLQFQVNIFEISNEIQNKRWVSQCHPGVLCTAVSQREFCGRMCARETMAHVCPWLKSQLAKTAMLVSANWIPSPLPSPRPPRNLVDQLIGDFRYSHIQAFCKKSNLGCECWEKPNKSVGWHCPLHLVEHPFTTAAQSPNSEEKLWIEDFPKAHL